MHWSYANRGFCGLVQMQPDGRALLRHELGFREHTPERFAMDLLQFMAAQKIPELSMILLQEACFPAKNQRGETVSQTLSRCGLPISRGDDNTAAGWMRLRSWLTPIVMRGVEAPSLIIHASCTRTIRALPTVVSDPKQPDEIIESPNAFPAHALRRFCMARPVPHPDAPVELPPDAIGHDVQAIRDEIAREHGH